MKNGARPLYTLLHDPKQIAANGGAKKRAPGLRKKFLIGGIIAGGLLGAAWGFNQWFQDQAETHRRDEYITWVAKYRPNWSSPMIKAQWDKIKYAHGHAEIVAPVPTPAPIPIPAATPAAILVPLNSEPEESPKPADIPGGYWAESDNPQIGWHWIKGSPSKSGRFTDK